MVVLRKDCLTKIFLISSEFEKGEQRGAEVPDTAAWQNLRSGYRLFYSSQKKKSKSPKIFFVTSNHPYKKTYREVFFSRKSYFWVLPDNCLTPRFLPKTAMPVQKILERSLCAPRLRASWIPIPMGCLYPNLGTGGPRVNSFLAIAAWQHQNPKCQAKF